MNSKDLKQKRKTRLSTLEMLILVAVVVILAAVSVVSFLSMQDRAREAQTELAMENIVTAIELYRIDQEEYPPSGEGPQLIARLSDYLEGLPAQDAWGNPYVYVNTGDGYTLSSPGKDGVIGSGEDDIVFTDGKMTSFGRYPVRR